MESGSSCSLWCGVHVPDLTSKFSCWAAATPIFRLRCEHHMPSSSLLLSMLGTCAGVVCLPYTSVITPQRRYDAGCRSITNIDFSKICIKEMMVKNLRERPLMKWIVMDMTQMTVGYMLSLTLVSASKWREVHNAVLLWCMQTHILMPDLQLIHSGLCIVQLSSANTNALSVVCWHASMLFGCSSRMKASTLHLTKGLLML